MIKSNRNGKIGEDIACEFYEANGYTVKERNYRAGHNEIDIIAENDSSLVFAEVKTRTNTPTALKYGSPRTAVTAGKQSHLLDAAKCYLRTLKRGKQPRMDVVEVYLDEDGKFVKLHYLRNAFGERETKY